MSNLLSNPFQRWVAQRGFKSYLNKHRFPLHSLYTMLLSSVGNSYISAPVTSQGKDSIPTVRKVLLGELYGQWVDCATDSTSRLLERVIYVLTSYLRDYHLTLITEFAGLLFQLLDSKTVENEADTHNILFSNKQIYSNLANYPGGLEIELSFELMERYLTCSQLTTIAEVVSAVSELPCDENTIPPSVIKVLNSLRSIGLDIVSYVNCVSQVNKQSSLLRANNSLDLLKSQVNTQVVTPEQIVLKKIIYQWRKLVSEAGGEIGRAAILKPVPNPYIAGSPVIGDIFVGREDIIRRLEELWSVPHQAPSIVLYGHRRMGKTSILQNLQACMGSHTTVINFNLQLFGNVCNTNELLYALACEIYDSLPLEQQQKLQEPSITQFTTYNPYQTLIRFLKKLDKIRNEQRFVITIDEFELLEKLIEDAIVEQELIRFWRGLIQTYPWFIMIFAGLHTLNRCDKIIGVLFLVV